MVNKRQKLVYCIKMCVSKSNKRAKESRVTELVSFAREISRDYAAVRAACSRPESNGIMEGHANRLKFFEKADVWPCSSRPVACESLARYVASHLFLIGRPELSFSLLLSKT